MKFKLKYQKHLLKIFSLVFAIFVWLYVVNSAQIEADKEVKIQYKLPPGFAISNEAPKHVIYSLKGPRGFIKTIQKRDDLVVINLEKIFDIKKKKYRFDAKNLGLDFPFGVDLEATEPANIQVYLEKEVIKEVPVIVQTASVVPENFEMVSSHFEPSRVSISGAYSVVKDVNSISTLPIDLSSLKGSGTKEVGFEIRDRRVELASEAGTYIYEVRSTKSNLLLAKVPITFMTTQLIRNVNRRTVNLMVLARDGDNSALDKDKVRVIADIPANSSGQVVIELKADLPDGYELVEIRPEKITVTVE